MKKLIFLFFSGLLILNLRAIAVPTDTYIIVGENTYYCDEIHLGKAYTRIYSEGKQLLRVPTYLIKAYARGGKFYEYLPVLTQDQDTAGWAFMQFIASRDGERLYQFCSNCLKYDPVTGKIEPTMPVYRYYTFNHGKFVSVTDDTNLQAQLSSFGVRVIS